jgi:hypothetical protein
MTQVVEHLPSKCEVLSSKIIITKEKNTYTQMFTAALFIIAKKVKIIQMSINL